MYFLYEKEMYLPMNLWSVTNFLVQVNFQTPFFLSVTIIMESAKRIRKKNQKKTFRIFTEVLI